MKPMRFLVTEVEHSNKLRGKLLSGSITPNASIVLAPGGQQSTVMAIRDRKGNSLRVLDDSAQEAELEFTYSLPARPGNLIASADARPEFSDQFVAQLNWQSAADLLPGRTYRLESIGGNSEATISRLKYRLDEGRQIAAKTLAENETGVVNVALTHAILYDPETVVGRTAEFTLSDRESGEQVARGSIRHGLRRASNVHWQALDVDKQSRAAIKQQAPRIIWLTGLSGSGKSTIANMVEKKLLAAGKHSYLLDGDNVRHGLNKDLGFTDADRVENIRRVAETAKLMLDAGLIVITSFISPFRAERDMARTLFEQHEFIEVYVNTSLDVCEQRDPKGLYRKARSGEIKNFTGLDSPYEAPERAELTLDTVTMSVEEAADNIISYLQRTAEQLAK